MIPADLEGKTTTDVATVAKVLGTGLNQTYAAVREGRIKSLRIGNRYVIPVAPLLEQLGLDAA